MTKDQLNQLFTYKNGELFWNLPRKRVKAGSKAGSVLSNGYESICLNQKRYYTHRLIFMMFNGYLPKEIDHVDGNSLNNCIDNLREANRATNMQNIKLSKFNKSGYKNVYWHSATQKWKVQFNVNKKRMFFGSFDDLELADLVAQEARDKYHREFARHI
jgi:hypothetical protein